MEEKEFLYLLKKLNDQTIQPDELRKLKKAYNNFDHIKNLLRDMNQSFSDILDREGKLADYAHKDIVAQRLRKNLALDHPKTYAKPKRYWLKITSGAAIILAILGFLFLARPDNKPVRDLEWVLVKTQAGERKKITLNDGTEITMNGSSSLQYTKKEQDSVRLVQFDGEAFFNVAKNPSKPFVVISKDFTTRVVGTAFNIDSDIEKAITVQEGKVQLYAIPKLESLNSLETKYFQTFDWQKHLNATNQTIILSKGSKALLNMDMTWSNVPFLPQEWMENILVHMDEPIQNVIRKAQRNYGDSIALHSNINITNKVTISFKNRNKIQVINTLTELIGGKLEKDEQNKIWKITKNKR